MRDRIMWGVGAGVLGQGLNVAGRIILVPLFLNAWGAAAYGEWLLLSSLPAWLALSDLGGQVYFVNRLTAAWAAKDIPTFRKLLGTALAVFLFIPASLFLLFSLAIAVFPVESWLGISVTPPAVAKGVLFLLAFQVLVSLPQGLILGVYRAIGALPRGVMLSNGMLFFQLVFTVGLLLSKAGMVAIAAVQSVPAIVVALYALRDLAKRLPERGLFDLRGASRETAREALHPSLHFFGIQIAQALAIQGSILAVGWTLGAIEVAMFATLRTLVNLARQMLGLLSHSAWPEFTRLDAAGDHGRLHGLIQMLNRLTFLGALMLVLVLEFFGQELFRLWLHGRLPYDPVAMKAFEAYILLTVFWTLNANLLMATNRHEALARWQAVFAALGVGLCYIGASAGSLDRAVVGLVFGEALPMMMVTTVLLSSSQMGIPLGSLMREALPPVASAVTVMIYPPAAVAILIWQGMLVLHQHREGKVKCQQ